MLGRMGIWYSEVVWEEWRDNKTNWPLSKKTYDNAASTLSYSDQAQRSGGIFLFFVLQAVKKKQFKCSIPALRKD